MNRIYIIVSLLVIVGAFAYTLTSAPPNRTTSTNIVTEIPDGVVENSPTQTSTKEVVVTGDNFSFDPNEIRVNQNDVVTIVFKNSGGLHDFVIDEFGVATKQIGDNQEDRVTFTADKKGEFEYYCSVGNHRQMGMVGKIIVE